MSLWKKQDSFLQDTDNALALSYHDHKWGRSELRKKHVLLLSYVYEIVWGWLLLNRILCLSSYECSDFRWIFNGNYTTAQYSPLDHTVLNVTFSAATDVFLFWEDNATVLCDRNWVRYTVWCYLSSSINRGATTRKVHLEISVSRGAYLPVRVGSTTLVFLEQYFKRLRQGCESVRGVGFWNEL